MITLRTIQTTTGRTITVNLDGDSFVISGGEHGEHRLLVSATDTARLDSHVDGYVETNGGELSPTEIRLDAAKPLSGNDGPAVTIQLPNGHTSIRFVTPEAKVFDIEAMPYEVDGAPQCVDLRPITPDPRVEQWQNGDKLLPRWRVRSFGTECRDGSFGGTNDTEASAACLIFDW